MALLQIVYCKNTVQCLYTLLQHQHYTSTILLKMAQVSCSIAMLAIRKEVLKVKLHDCSLAAG